MLGTCIAGGALTAAVLGAGPIASFAGMVVGGEQTLGEPLGLLRHPSNLNLGWFVRFIADHTVGDRPWAAGAGLVTELILAGLSFAAAWALVEDRYACGFALWIALITLLSPISWQHFLVCLVPVYVSVAAACQDGAASRLTLFTAGTSYLAAFFMGGPTVGFINAGMERLLRGHVHLWHAVPEFTFASLVLAYCAALLMTTSENRPPANA